MRSKGRTVEKKGKNRERMRRYRATRSFLFSLVIILAVFIAVNEKLIASSVPFDLSVSV